MRYLLLLSLLTACATSAPRTYAQGAPMPPSAPAFEPAWEAPHTTGQPGYVGPAEQLPRSPHKRVLPETPDTQRGPGLWAGDQPRAAGEPSIGGVPIVLPVDPRTGEQPRPASCASSMDDILRDLDMWNLMAGLREADRRCLAARLYEHCVVTGEAYNRRTEQRHRKRAKMDPIPDEPGPEVGHAKRLVGRDCPASVYGPLSEEIFRNVTSEWDMGMAASR